MAGPPPPRQRATQAYRCGPCGADMVPTPRGTETVWLCPVCGAWTSGRKKITHAPKHRGAQTLSPTPPPTKVDP